MSSDDISKKLEELVKREASMKFVSYFFLGLLLASMVEAAYEYYYPSSVVFASVATILYFIELALAGVLASITRLSLLRTHKLVRALKETLAKSSLK